MKTVLSALFLIIISLYDACSQVDSDSTFFQMQAEYRLQETDLNEQLESIIMQEDIFTRENEKVNLGNPDPLDLLKLPGLTASQIESVHQYILDYGPLLTIWELYLIKALDSVCISKILPFIEVDQKRKTIANAGKNQLVISGTSKGSARFKTCISDKKQLALSLSCKSDSLSTGSISPENIHGNLSISAGYINRLVIGDFRLAYGQGLCFAPGTSFFTSGDDWRRRSQGIRPYQGYSGYGSGRGGAINLSCGKYRLDAFVSVKPVEKYYGFHLGFGKSIFKVGLTAFNSETAIDSAVSPVYSGYSFKGGSYSAAGIDYVMIMGKAALYGEFCSATNQPAAWINGFRYDPFPRLGFQLMLRNYPLKFSNPYASSYSLGGDPQNENSLMMQIRSAIYHGIELNGTIDLAYFSWYHYRLDNTSYPMAVNLQAAIRINSNTNIGLSWRRRLRSLNKTSEAKMHEIVNIGKDIYQASINHRVTDKLLFTSRAVFVLTNSDGLKGEGYMMSHDILYEAGRRLKLRVRYCIFETDTYDQRIYLYENNVPEVFSVNALYGSGSLFYLMIRYKLHRRLVLNLKYGQDSGGENSFQASAQLNLW